MYKPHTEETAAVAGRLALVDSVDMWMRVGHKVNVQGQQLGCYH